MVKTAIVGCGAIAQVHSRVLSEMENVSLIACADIRYERAQKMAETYGAHAYSDLESLLAAETPDVLHILTPHAFHTPMAEQAARRGIAIFTEKPPAINEDQWNAFKNAAQKVPTGICFQNRFNYATQVAKKIVEAPGNFGKILGARAFVTWKRGDAYYTESGWRGTWKLEGGGALINQAIHTLDLLVYLLGKPSSCAASMHNYHLENTIEVEDTVEARIQFGDVPCLFYASTGYGLDAPILLEIAFEHAVIRLEGTDSVSVIHEDGTVDKKTDTGSSVLGKGYWGAGHTACIRSFYQCLTEGVPFCIGVNDVDDTLHLLFDLYRKGGLAPTSQTL